MLEESLTWLSDPLKSTRIPRKVLDRQIFDFILLIVASSVGWEVDLDAQWHSFLIDSIASH